MNKEKELNLVENFPLLFREYNGPASKTCMAFGIECGSGWYNELYEMCEELSKLNDPDLFFLQIKEKFGDLRAYTSKTSNKIAEIVSSAERKCYHVCEKCGKSPAQKHSTEKLYWIKNLCNDCISLRETDKEKFVNDWQEQERR